MNFKQKLVYMLIGCLFTLAGYFLASLGNNEIPNAHAQQNEEQVIDKIVCREIEIVDEAGNLVANLKHRNDNFAFGGSALIFYGLEGQETLRLDSSSMGGGALTFYAFKGRKTLDLRSWSSFNSLYFYNLGGNMQARLTGTKMDLYNNDGAQTVSLEGRNSGHLLLFNNDREKLVILHSDMLGEGGMLNIFDSERSMLLRSSSLHISNEGTKVLRADVDRKGGGMITTYDKHGNHTGRLPR